MKRMKLFGKAIALTLLYSICACAPNDSEEIVPNTPGGGGGGDEYKTLTIVVKDATGDDLIDGVIIKLVKTGVSAKPTGEKGTYVFDQLRDTSYDISLSKAGYIPKSENIKTDRDTQETTIELTRDVSVEGRITTTDGRPLSNTFVYLIPTRNDDTMVEVGSGNNGDGLFSFSGLPNGASYQLFIFKDGYKSVTERPVRVPDYAAHVQMTAKESGNIGFDKLFMDFGEATDKAVLNVDTKGNPDLTWQLVCDVDWLTFDISSGIGNNSVILTIDRNYLSAKNSERIARILITADGKSDEAWVVVSGAGGGVNIGDLITLSTKDVTSNSATVSSIVLHKDRKEKAKQIGVCYSYENKNPTCEKDDSQSVDLSAVDESGEYAVPLKGLVAEKTYYVRAYVIDDNGLIYYSPNVRSFTTDIEVIAPEVIVSDATNIKSASATLNANILNIGSPSYTKRGFCYSKNSLPAITDNKIEVDGFSDGGFSYDITGLEVRTTYYVRAYVIQDGKVVYSNNIKSFNTIWLNTEITTYSPTKITATTATFNGTITSVGSPVYSERGFCYSIGNYSYPEITDKKVRVEGNGIVGDFGIIHSGLEPEKSYSVRAYAIQNGEVSYGESINFSTIYTQPTVRTLPESNLKLGSVSFNGRIDSAGNPQHDERGFCWTVIGVEEDSYYSPTISDDHKAVTSYSYDGSFSMALNNVPELKVYIYRAYVRQGAKVFYGEDRQCITGSTPIVQTGPAKDIIYDPSMVLATGSVTLQGYVNFTGWPKYSEKGFEITNTYAFLGQLAQKVPADGLANTGLYTKKVSGLKPNLTYYARAYVENDLGIKYGDVIQFTIK